jgi:hypothetical protein
MCESALNRVFPYLVVVLSSCPKRSMMQIDAIEPVPLRSLGKRKRNVRIEFFLLIQSFGNA